MLNNPYGDFIKDGAEFRIKTPNLPRNWYNYLWNDNYITFVSQTGAGDGFVQDDLGRRINLVADRCVFLTEGDRHWGVSGLPAEEKRDSFQCEHGLGSTKIYTQKFKVKTKLTFFVPANESCELWCLKVRNVGKETRSFQVLAYAGTQVDWAYTRQGYNLARAEFNEHLNALTSRNYCDFYGKKNRHFYSFFALSDKADGFDGAANAFIGPYGSFAHPAVLQRGGCSNQEGNSEKLGYALQKNLVLEPGEEKEIIFICGIAFSREEMENVISRYRLPEVAFRELSRVRAKCKKQIGGVDIVTPDRELNYLFGWLKHEANLGSRWARVRHNGFRDMTSDCECVAAFNPSLALERFKRVLGYQYPNGYAPRTVRDGKICDNNFADNAVWIAMTACSIMKETGDASIFNSVVHFNDGSRDTLYEHVRRAVEFLYNFRGFKGLIRIWGGDWNDCMNEAGLNGKGVSVWLSLAWVRANDCFAEIAAACGRNDDAATARERGAEVRHIIEQYGWDGEYYRCAYNDWEEPIGASSCKEGKIFLIPQIWAVFAGVSATGREKQAMEAAEKYLSTPLGTVISYPPYTVYDPHIGTVTTKPAGVHENGGVYLHTIAWKIAADALLKKADRVEADLETILPFRNKVVDGKAEPYVLCNSYFAAPTGYRYGTPGQSWRTASGQWLQKALINYVFGLQPEMAGLKIDPCLPPSWKKASVTKKFRQSVFEITYENHGTAIDKILYDGRALTGNILPDEPGKHTVTVITKEP